MSLHHSFDIAFAAKYGIEEALLIHHFQHWINVNARRKKNFIEGRTWTFQTIQEIADHFPYLSYHKVKHAILKLIAQGVLMIGKFHKDPMKKTNWYAFHNEVDFSINSYERENSLMDRENSPFLYKEEDTKQEDTTLSLSHARGEELVQKEGHKLGTIPHKEVVLDAEGLPVIKLSNSEQELLIQNTMKLYGLTPPAAKKLVDETVLEYRLQCGANEAEHARPYFAILKWVKRAISSQTTQTTTQPKKMQNRPVCAIPQAAMIPDIHKPKTLSDHFSAEQIRRFSNV